MSTTQRRAVLFFSSRVLLNQICSCHLKSRSYFDYRIWFRRVLFWRGMMRNEKLGRTIRIIARPSFGKLSWCSRHLGMDGSVVDSYVIDHSIVTLIWFFAHCYVRPLLCSFARSFARSPAHLLVHPLICSVARRITSAKWCIATIITCANHSFIPQCLSYAPLKDARQALRQLVICCPT